MMIRVCIISSFFLFGCIDPFNPVIPLEERTGTLVVDGRITDQDGPYVVRLSSSKSISSDQAVLMESGARVVIEEENGPSVMLVESQSGTYVTNPGDIKGEIGKRYRLSLRLFDGLEYQSSWELMRETPEIDEIRIEFESKETSERDNITGQTIGQGGAQLYVSTQGVLDQATFFRWEIHETWKYKVPLASDSIYFIEGTALPKPPEDFHEVCWKNSRRGDIMITSVNDLSEPMVVNHPLVFISSDSARLNILYSALIKQYAIGIEEYDFWRNLENTNQNVGSLFDKQPFQVTGNVKNMSGGEAVLGYFSANAVTEKRIYINRMDFPDGILPDPEFSDCKLYEHPPPPGAVDWDANLRLLMEGGLRIFYSAPYTFTTPVCGDCEVYGGSTVVPIFWEE